MPKQSFPGRGVLFFLFHNPAELPPTFEYPTSPKRRMLSAVVSSNEVCFNIDTESKKKMITTTRGLEPLPSVVPRPKTDALAIRLSGRTLLGFLRKYIYAVLSISLERCFLRFVCLKASQRSRDSLVPRVLCLYSVRFSSVECSMLNSELMPKVFSRSRGCFDIDKRCPTLLPADLSSRKESSQWRQPT